MSYSALNLGAVANDGTGDPARTGGTKINANFTELYTFLGGTTLGLTANELLFGAGASPISHSADLTWSGTTGLLSQKGISSKGAANGTGTELFGLGASDASTQSASNNTLMGANASVTQTFITKSVVIGANASTTGSLAVIIGADSTSTGGNDVVIGRGLSNTAQFAVVIGSSNSASNDAIFTIGSTSSASHTDAGVLGWGGASQQATELSWGSRRTTSAAPSFRMFGGTATAFQPGDTFRINTQWIDATLATRKARAILSTYDTAEREFMRADANGTGVDVFFNGASYTFNVPIKPKGYTVATLPAGVIGQHAYVTDALAPAFLAVIVGGGAVVTPVFYNGANWVSH